MLAVELDLEVHKTFIRGNVFYLFIYFILVVMIDISFCIILLESIIALTAIWNHFLLVALAIPKLKTVCSLPKWREMLYIT